MKMLDDIAKKHAGKKGKVPVDTLTKQKNAFINKMMSKKSALTRGFPAVFSHKAMK